ncbi:helix-turn-helix domain-containing protein [Streptomyces spirodelae]|uniref:Helix-turn-helix transcriptional regulator n=1 Tax=Streptomyces spirodelae TaxID=2812904 RepID=A0ABS3WNF8_9ACTN|nr:helix-turn-helix transcriptional regulator [Streptomyces spirodelae]MBO8184646.1 helix-turn-helix transcriptional regulator [Streptomyces spirodelae]
MSRSKKSQPWNPWLNHEPSGALGEDVQRFREARGMSQEALGHATGYSKSYVSKVESGAVIPSQRFAEGCDKVFSTGGLFARQLRRIIEGENPSWFAPFIEAEREAEVIEDYSTLFVYGLLQTPEYARAALDAVASGADPRDLDAKVAGRMRRREIMLRGEPPQIWVVLHEACLRANVGTPEVMATQLRFLRDAVTQCRTLALQVLPLSASAAARATPFTLLGFEDGQFSVHVEGPQGGRPYDDKAALKNSRRIFDHLRACALSPHASLDFIDTVREAHERQARMDQVQLQRRRGRQLRRVGPGARVRRQRGGPGAGQ